MKPSIAPTVKSAGRVLDLLELLVRRGRGMTHTEIALALDIPKSSLTQLVGNLAQRGYLAFTPGPNTWTPGSALAALAGSARRAQDLAVLAQPLCERITRATNESSSLNLLAGDEVRRVCGASSTQPLHFSMTVGDTAPLYAVSSGKMLLALLPDAEREERVRRLKFRRVTPRTITSAAVLRRDLQNIARDRVAWSFEEFTPGIVGVAVAVLDGAGRPAGAFNVALPSVRDNPKHRKAILAALREAAGMLERELAAQRR